MPALKKAAHVGGFFLAITKITVISLHANDFHAGFVRYGFV